MNTVNLLELIEELQGLLETYGNIPVMTSSDYGDYTHTEQLNNIKAVDMCIPVSSAYSSTGLAFPDDNDEEKEDLNNKEKRIIVLRYTD